MQLLYEVDLKLVFFIFEFCECYGISCSFFYEFKFMGRVLDVF